MSVNARIAAAAGLDERHRRFVDRILSEEPSVAAAHDDWQFLTALRIWAYRNIRRQTDYSTLLDVRPEYRFYSRDAVDIFDAFAEDLGGVVGGGCGFALRQLYEIFGFQSLIVDCGSPADGFTRISVITKVSDEGIWAVQDPNYDFALTTRSGGPIDIREVIRLLMLGRDDEIVRADGDPGACREIIMTPEQLAVLDQEWTIDPPYPKSQPIRTLPDGRMVFRSHMTMARYAALAKPSYEYLISKGLSQNLLYFYSMVFAVYPADASEAGELLEQIQALQAGPREIPKVSVASPSDKGHGQSVAAREEYKSIEPFEGSVLDLEAYRRYGLFIIRDFFSAQERESFVASWENFYASSLREKRAVAGGGGSNQDLYERPPAEIQNLYGHPLLVGLMQRIWGEDIVFCQQRILIKDAQFGGGVPPHQDISYYRGRMEKTGVFVPLTACGPDNGGLHFILESHKLGYLGDRGYVPYDRLVNNSIPPFRSVCPTLRPGDIALMDICTLHFSLDATRDDPRVYVNPYYQPATDGSYRSLLSGSWRTDVFWSDCKVEEYFKTNGEIFGEQIKALQQN